MVFQYKNNQLHWYDLNLAEITDFHTPFHLIHENAIDESVKRFGNLFNQAALSVALYYSFKTNPVPAFLSYLHHLGLGVEVISEFELEFVKKIGFSPVKILVNGAGKSTSYLEKAIDSEVAYISLWSLNELAGCIEIAKNMGKRPQVLIRICPEFTRVIPDFSVNSATKDSPHGIPIEELNKDFFIRLSRENAIRFKGFHFHLGSGIHSIKPFERTLSKLKKVMMYASSAGLEVEVLDIGGGFGNPETPLFSFRELFRHTSQISTKHPSERVYNEFLSKLPFRLNNFIQSVRNRGIQLKKVIAEPGRILSAATQLTIVRVKEVIPRKRGNDILICDGGAMSLSPMLLTEYHSVLPLTKRTTNTKVYNIFGNLPSSLDRIGQNVKLPEIHQDDYLAILNTGAYFIPFENQFAGPRPGILMVKNNQLQVVRRPEDFSDVFTRDKWDV